MRRFLSVLTLSVVVLAGCGGGGGTASTSTSALTTSSTVPPYVWPPVVQDIAKDVSSASGVALKVADMPTGWVGGRGTITTTPDDKDLDQAFVQCMMGPNPSPLTAYTVGPFLRSQSGDTIAQSFVRVVSSPAAARNDFTSFKPARARTCIASMYDRQMSLQPPIVGRKFGAQPPGLISVDTIVPPDNSTDVIALRFAITPVDTSATYVDVFAYGKGRFEMVLLVQDGRTNPSASDELGALKALKQRVDAAAGA